MELGLGFYVGRSIRGLGRLLGGRRYIAVPNPFPTKVGGAASTFSQAGNVITITSGVTLDAYRADSIFTLGMHAVMRLTINGTGTMKIFAGNGSGVNTTVSASSTTVTYDMPVADAGFIIIRVQSANFTGTVTIEEIYEE